MSKPPLCCDSVPMHPRPTISHGLCWLCPKCGCWADAKALDTAGLPGVLAKLSFRYNNEPPPIALHHLPNSPN